MKKRPCKKVSPHEIVRLENSLLKIDLSIQAISRNIPVMGTKWQAGQLAYLKKVRNELANRLIELDY